MEEDKKNFEVSSSLETADTEEKKKISLTSKSKKVKSLFSLLILVSGLFIGSLFVDVAQMLKGEGISRNILSGKDVFELDGKTWVAYNEPVVEVNVISDDNCEKCDVSEALLWLRKMSPTVLTKKINYDSEKGRELIGKLDIKSLPAFVFAKEITETEFYSQAEVLFKETKEGYILDTARLGLPAGRYLSTPTIGENDVKIGNESAKVKLVVFSDFQCPFSKAFNSTIKRILEEYGDKILYSYKHFPLSSIHPRAKAAGQAAECAKEQNKFLEYANKLFDKQEEWSKTESEQPFKNYASQLGLNSAEFGKCLSENKYKERVESTLKEAESFGISGTPGIFINDQFQGGAVDFETIKKIIDNELNK